MPSPLPLSQVLSDRALDMMQSYAFFPVQLVPCGSMSA
jgi:hypothetical protein